jgi:hypothetical protein
MARMDELNSMPIPTAYQVLRAYDNRACFIERRPDVYLYSGETGPTEIICDIRAGPATDGDVDFGGTPSDLDQDSGVSWLWTRTSSRLLVISTPYYEGRHWALSPSEFTPLLAQLEALHSKGFVHGDIRCFNIAFGPTSRLFDCDYGGRAADDSSSGATRSPRGGNDLVCDDTSDAVSLAAVARYPLRYRQDLADGSRVGQGGNVVTKFDDWYALASVILRCHRFDRPRSEKDGSPIGPEYEVLADFPFDITAAGGTGAARCEIAHRSRRLKEFLDKMEEKSEAGLTVRPTLRFRQELVRLGFMNDEDSDVEHRREGSGRPDHTGSPHKQVPHGGSRAG